MSTRILHLTDLHLHADENYKLQGINTEQSLLDVLQHVQQQPYSADLVLITGDLTHDETEAGYQRLVSILKHLQIPVYVLPGNHDIVPLMQQNLNQENISTQAHILLPGWQIIMLDSVIEKSESGHLSDDQFELLEQRLKTHPEHHTLVCLHHQPCPIGSRWLDTMQVDNGKQLILTLKQYPRVKALLWGHVHQAFTEQLASFKLLATPSTCKQFKPGAYDFATDDNPPGYRWLVLQDDGQLDTEVVWI